MNNASDTTAKPIRPFVMAMVLGTALTALAPPEASATAAQAGPRTVNAIERYCTVCWRNGRLPPAAWDDCTQEVFSRLLERLPGNAWERVLVAESDERRELVRAVDAVKKRTQRARRATGSLDGVADRRDLDSRHLADQRAEVDQVAGELLSPRQQRIMQLGFDGWSVHEIAAELSLAPERVSDEKYKAVRKLRAHLCRDE